MSWSLPQKWILPPGEVFYKTIPLYEHTKTEYDFVVPHIKEYRTAIDIGAHIGTTTLRYAKDFKKVCAFEPLYHKELVANTNQLDNVEIYKFAVSDKKQKMQMKKNRTNSGMTMLISNETKDYLKKRADWFENIAYDVECISLDECNIKDVDFIKIDTENYVYPILMGAINILKEYSPVLQIELTQNVELIDYFLSSLGYERYHTFSVDRFYKK